MCIKFMCDQCFHPVLSRKQPCPFCQSTNIAKKCPDCGAPMYRLPHRDSVTSTTDICHPCAFKAGLAAAK